MVSEGAECGGAGDECYSSADVSLSPLFVSPRLGHGVVKGEVFSPDRVMNAANLSDQKVWLGGIPLI